MAEFGQKRSFEAAMGNFCIAAKTVIQFQRFNEHFLPTANMPWNKAIVRSE